MGDVSYKDFNVDDFEKTDESEDRTKEGTVASKLRLATMGALVDIGARMWRHGDGINSRSLQQ